ncbi:S8 family serine peptidase [Angustibacter peucedani]
MLSGGAVAALAAATLGATPALAATNDHHGLAHRLKDRIPAGTKSAGSIGLGTKRLNTDGEVDRDLVSAKGKVSVMIELDAAPASRAFTTNRSRGTTAARAAGKAQTKTVQGQQRAVESHFSAAATKAKVIYRAHALYSGIAVTTDASRLQALAKLPGVKAIHRLTPKTVDNSSSVPLIGAPAVWKAHSNTGEGVRVGVIDTGIDYTHSDFGGAGTTAAFDAAKASPTFSGTAKVVGGYDFAGDAYAPGDGVDDPTPDPNPLDCNGHGSHTAGTTAGLGVNSDGSTYTGSYATDLDPADFRIGPGVAPGASLYALKVFGCDGSTNLVGQALDWAADPNGDGDVSDHLDVVNMSLGSSYGSPDDPDAVASNNLAALGTVVVASIGNSGDVYEVGGSPGNATRVLAVAASDDGNDVVDGLKVDSPAGIEPADTVDGVQDDIFGALKSVAYDWTNEPGVSNLPVVKFGDWSQPPSASNNTDGCNAYSPAQATAMAGKIVLQYWTDGTDRRCGSVARAGAARTAGAAGAIFGDDQNAFSAGVTGDAVIPAMIVVKQGTDALAAAIDDGDDVRATMTNALRNSVSIKTPGAVDQLASFSSRGIGRAGNVKPDVAAPGVTTFSVAVGTGDEGIAESGTSMASPHVAGEAALVRAAHSSWTVEEVKAAIMNTATQDVFVGTNHTGDVYGPERVGSGRVKADAAVDTATLAYSKDDAGAVSVSFGPIAATKDLSLTKTIHVVNKRAVSAATYTIAYTPAHATPGVTYTVSPSQVSLPAGGSADVKVTVKVDRSALRHSEDPTTDSDPLGTGLQRNYRTDASGRVVMTPTGSTTGGKLRVPVWSAPRAASAMTQASKLTLGGAYSKHVGQLALTGTGVDQGTVLAGGDLSTVSTFQLQEKSPKIASCSSTLVVDCIAFPDDRSADLQYVGSSSDAAAYIARQKDPLSYDPQEPYATLNFGVSTWGPWRTPASYNEFDVLLDTNGDGTEDAAVYNTRLATSTDDFDYFVAETVDLRPGHVGELIDQELINLMDGSLDTGVFNSDVLTMSVGLPFLADAGLISSSTPKINYWVESFSAETGLVDTAGSSDAAKSISWKSPALRAEGDTLSIINQDVPDSSLEVSRDDVTLANDKPMGLLLLHHLNTDGARAQVATVTVATTTKLSVSDTDYKAGFQPTLTATVAPKTATGSVLFRDGNTSLGTATLVNGKATLKAPKLAKGTHKLRATYTGNQAGFASSSSSYVTVVVR